MKWEFEDMSWGEFLHAMRDLPIESHKKLNGVLEIRLDRNNHIDICCGNTPSIERIEELEGFLNDLAILVKEQVDG